MLLFGLKDCFSRIAGPLQYVAVNPIQQSWLIWVLRSTQIIVLGLTRLILARNNSEVRCCMRRGWVHCASGFLVVARTASSVGTFLENSAIDPRHKERYHSFKLMPLLLRSAWLQVDTISGPAINLPEVPGIQGN